MRKPLGVQCFYESKEILEAAENHPTTIEQVKKQFAKLNDTVFTLQNLEFEECGAFLPVKMINQARREIVDRLYEKKINNKPRRVLTETVEAEAQTDASERDTVQAQAPYLTASVTTREQYEACRKAGLTGNLF